MHIFFIHGANSTRMSFSYFEERFNQTDMIDLEGIDFTHFEYNAATPIEDIIDAAVQAVKKTKTKVHIISHSMGGLIGTAVSQRLPSQVKSVVTMGTPYGGSKMAAVATLLKPFDTFLQNVHPHNSTLSEIRSTSAVVPTFNLITCAGNTMFEYEDNDGVVTIDSQKRFTPTEIEEFAVNHFEILQSNRAFESIYKFTTTHNAD